MKFELEGSFSKLTHAHTQVISPSPGSLGFSATYQTEVEGTRLKELQVQTVDPETRLTKQSKTTRDNEFMVILGRADKTKCWSNQFQ